MKTRAWKVVQRLIFRSLLQGFERWHDVAQRQGRRNDLVQRLWNNFVFHRFVLWQSRTSDGKCVRRKALIVVRRLTNRILGSSFGCWKDHSGTELRFQKIERRVTNSWTRLKCRQLLGGWKLACEERIHERCICTKIFVRWINLLVSQCLDHWCDTVAGNRLRDHVRWKAVACWINRKLVQVWNQWSAYLDYRHRAHILGRMRETFSSRRFSQIKYNILEMFRVNGKFHRMRRTNLKSRFMSLFGKFVLGLEAQRVSVRRMVSAQNYAKACLESKVYGAWHSWFEAHKNHRIKAHLGYVRVSTKYVKRITLRNWSLWQHHRDDHVYPILRRFERLARRSLMKVASDVVPELLHAEVNKAMTKILLGPLLGPMGQMQGLARKSILENAFNTWSKRQPAFKPAISLAISKFFS